MHPDVEVAAHRHAVDAVQVLTGVDRASHRAVNGHDRAVGVGYDAERVTVSGLQEPHGQEVGAPGSGRRELLHDHVAGT